MEKVKAALEVLETLLRPRTLFAVTMVLSAIAVGVHTVPLPPEIVRFGRWINFGAVIVAAAWVAVCGIWLGTHEAAPWEKLRRRRAEREALAYLDTLAVQERVILFYAFQQNQQSMKMPPSDAWGNALCAKGLLRRERGIGTEVEWPYTVPNFVWAELHSPRRVEWVKLEMQKPEVANRVRTFVEDHSPWV